MRVGVTTYFDELDTHQAGSDVVAYFDLDRTLIAGYSVTALAWERFRTRTVPLRRVVSQLGVFLDYGLGRVQIQEIMSATMNDLAGTTETEFVELGRRAYEKRLVGSVYQEGRKLLDRHRSLGHEVVMVTSATRAQAAPIAADLEIEHLLCTELEIDSGRLTGGFQPCWGDSKLAAAEALAEAHGWPMQTAYFYSDSLEDLPLLEAVGRPVATNAKASLARIAAERDWIELQFSRNRERQAA